MSKCPLYGKCTGIDKSLLSMYSDEDLEVHYSSQRFKFEHVMCQGKGNPSNQWDGCAKYLSEKTSNQSSTSASSGASSSSGGCYIATCVYGSYDCPEVWTLRRFRDDKLSHSCVGRLFIRGYYAVSPKIVRLLGDNKWFIGVWKSVLDKFTSKLLNSGISNSPYSDKDD